MTVSQVHWAATIGEYAANQVAICHFLANNRGPDISSVDVVLSHHCALPPPKAENNTVPSTRYVGVMIRGVAMRRRIRKLYYENFCWRHFSCVRKFALTKISRYTVIEIIIRYQSSVQNGSRRLQYCTHCQDGKLRMSICTQSIYLATHSASHSNRNTMWLSVMATDKLLNVTCSNFVLTQETEKWYFCVPYRGQGHSVSYMCMFGQGSLSWLRLRLLCSWMGEPSGEVPFIDRKCNFHKVSGVLAIFRPEWNTGSHVNAKFKS